MKPSLYKSVGVIAGIACLLITVLTTTALTTIAAKESAPTDRSSKAVLRVEGMTCGGCVSTIQNSLAPLGGIDNVQGALIQNAVVVRFHPNPNDFVLTCHVQSPKGSLATHPCASAQEAVVGSRLHTKSRSSAAGKPTSVDFAAQFVNTRCNRVVAKMIFAQPMPVWARPQRAWRLLEGPAHTAAAPSSTRPAPG